MSGAGADAIAVVGVAGRFPGAASVDAFWRNLRAGVESITFFSRQELEDEGIDAARLAAPGYVCAKGVLQGADEFDARFFGLTPREADVMDPQQRVFLECAWEALENAGYDPGRFPGPIGVFGGAGANTYLLAALEVDRGLVDGRHALHTSLHNRVDHLTSRVAYRLNLRGPAITVQTACSTSLVAVCLAAQSLLDYQCDMALAGGVNVSVPLRSGYLYQEGGTGSPDGHCRPFDASALGTVEGNGAGVVVLKRLEDAVADGDGILAVLRGWAVNNDGAARAGYTAPGLESQAEVIAAAQAMAGFAPGTMGYVEAHGTATPLGDPIEVEALKRAFGPGAGSAGRCALGSVKGNIGHLDAAAGVAGLIKAILCLNHRTLVPSLHFREPNPRAGLEAGPFHVGTRLCDWPQPAAGRRAGVSSFGIGGTNAHVVLEESPELAPAGAARPWQILLLSARSSAALESATAHLAAHLEAHPELPLADVAYTLQVGRVPFEHRRAVLCREAGEAVRCLRELPPQRVGSRLQEPGRRALALMFPGQGTQQVDMGRELYEQEPLFREALDQCAEGLQPHLGLDLREVLYPAAGEEPEAARRLDQTEMAQPALFAVEYALARLWMDWCGTPEALAGHSLGEYVAACLAGVWTLEDALGLVAARGQLMQGLPAGAMLSVAAPEDEVRRGLGNGLSLAAVNGPALCVVSGPVAAVDEQQRTWEGREVVCRRLRVSHAFHSGMMEPIAGDFERRLREVAWQGGPRIPCLSNLTGTWITEEQATDPRYWVRHLRETVRFGDNLAELLQRDRAVLEVGPGQSLRTLARWHASRHPGQVVAASLTQGPGGVEGAGALQGALGRLWLAGVPIHWDRFHAPATRRRVPLPAYPFERRRHWLLVAGRALPAIPSRRLGLADWFHAATWREADPPPLDIGRPGGEKTWLVMADVAGLGQDLARRLERTGRDVVTASAGDGFARTGERAYRLDPRRRADYAALLDAMESGGPGLPGRVVHLWGVTPSGAAMEAPALQDAGFYSLLFLAQALGERKGLGPLRLTVVTSDTYGVGGALGRWPEKATALGLCRVLSREYDGLVAESIDVGLAGAADGPALSERLLAEVTAVRAEPLVAWRNGRRWVPRWEAVQLGARDGHATSVREKGVYVISGGLGGVGLELAAALAAAAPVRLVLFGRSPFLERERWPEWLSSHPRHDRTSRTIRAIHSLEQSGTEVLLGQADVTERLAVEALRDHVHTRLGPVHGLIHAAGVPGGGLLQLRSAEAAARILAPKVQGTRVLAEVFQREPLDFLVLCSSLAAEVGRAGQADYGAANAFLDAFARSHSSCRTLSINWGEWRGVGMAAESGPGAGEPLPVDHPFLEQGRREGSGREVYPVRLSAKTHWILDEHRLVGTPVVPGVAYVEMVRAALGERSRGRLLELSDVLFVAPLKVPDDRVREARLVLKGEGDEFTFSVVSDAEWDGTGPGERTYVVGKARLLAPMPEVRHDVADLITLCRGREEAAVPEEAREEDLGPRWHNIQRAYVGEAEALLKLTLPDAFRADLESIHYHPALMDRAAGRAQEYLVEGVYLPVAYRRLRIHAPIPATLYSHARYRAADDPSRETLTFDTVVLDEGGRLLVEIEGFSQKRITDAGAGIKSLSAAPPAGEDATEGTGAAMSAAEGREVFLRLLDSGLAGQVAVCVEGLEATLEGGEAAARDRVLDRLARQGPPRARHPRPELAVAYAPPENATERRLAAAWQEALGLDRVGRHDNFFDLGGDSVQAIQIIAGLSQQGVPVTPQRFFQHQTVAELASALVEAGSPEAAPAAAPGPEPPVTPAAPELDEATIERLAVLLDRADGGAEQRLQALLRGHPRVRAAWVRPARDDGPARLVAEVVLDRPARSLQFSLFYFADDRAASHRGKYRLYLEGARYADRNGFTAVWTPERHFHEKGGLYPNPSVLSAALATATDRVRLRAGSVVLPLHQTLRVAEEWAVVDNLSGGRVDVSFTSGWLPNDFALFPERYPRKRDEMLRGIDEVRRLWRGESLPSVDGAGKPCAVRIFPRPIQPELPVWLTCSGDPALFVKAGELGLNVLTALLGQSLEDAAAKIRLYREALARHGHDPASGRVTMMLHTLVGADLQAVEAQVRGPLCAYLKSHLELIGTGARSLGLTVEEESVRERLDDVVAFAFERYTRTASLIGTPSTCLPMVDRLQASGVDEVACLIDFGVEVDQVLEGLPHLGALQRHCAARAGGEAEELAALVKAGWTEPGPPPDVVVVDVGV